MSEIQELIQRLQKLEDAFNEHCREKALCSANVQVLLPIIRRLEHTVFGNGKEGLTTVIARTEEKLAGVIDSVDRLPASIREQMDDAIVAAIAQLVSKETTKEQKPSPADNTVKWFMDKILPYFVTGLMIVLLQAVWELLKVKLNTP